jgi:two-component system, response regulator PdtaR
MEKRKILVVEDEFITATALQASLEDLGFEVVGTADTGEEAIRSADELKPDIILMDIQLIGEMNGIVAAGIIKEKYDIPVIFLTGQSDDATITRALESEPFGYIVKPFEEKNLKTSITMALYKRAMDEKLRRSEATVRGLLNATKDETVLVDNDGMILALNDAFAASAGKPAADLVNTVLYELIRTGSITMKTADEMQKKGEKSHLSFEEELKGRWLDTTIYSINDSQGNRQQVAIFRHDITGIKQAESQLKAINEQLVAEKERLALYAAALDNMRDCAIITASMGEILYVNATAEKKFGVKLVDLDGKKLKDLAHADNQINIGDYFFFDYKDVESQGLFLGKNAYGVKLPMVISGKPIMYYNKKPTHFVFVLREKMS